MSSSRGGVAAETANWSVAFSGTSSGQSIMGAFGPPSFSGNQAAALGPVDSGTKATTNQAGIISGPFTASTAGTLSLQCAEGTSGDTVIVANAYLDVSPTN